ncbi:MAG: rRNA maturation RNase YbeY [Chloroflexota bacterium]|nr:rRNA maturation RNase YbeY [Chloroflexota bacterium]
MGGAVTVHDRVGRERLAAAMEPLSRDAGLQVVESAILETAATCLGRTAVEVELTLCSDAEMERLNFDHMGERGPTDVLAFPLHSWTVDRGRSHLDEDDGASPPGRGLLLGDVVIDLDQAVRQAVDGDWTVVEEVALLAVHGTLHLLGHDHADIGEEQAMRAAEHTVLNALRRRYRDVEWRPGSLFDRPGHAVMSGT